MTDAPTPLSNSDRKSAQSNALAELGLRTTVPAELRHASGMKKLDWILSLPSTEDFVRELAPQDLYHWMRDIGKGDAYALLEYATDSQIKALVDIDAWSRHELSIPRWLEWLDLALAVDVETGMRYLGAQDDTTYLWLFTGDIQVLPADTDIDAIPDELAFFNTPDFMYVVTVPREHPLEERMPHLLKLMWATDTDRVRELFQQVQFELHEGTSEEMERFRSARLQDLGFEPPTDALEVYSVIAIKTLRDELLASLEEPVPEASSPIAADRALAFELSPRELEAPSLLRSAVASLDERERQTFGGGFAYLANKVFMADTGNLSRLDDLPQSARYAAATANLGLSYLASESDDLARRMVVRIAPELLFKTGWTLLFHVSRKARKVTRRSGADRGFALFGTPTDETLHAAQLLRPLWPEVLDDPERLGHRPLETLEELARMEARVDHASALLDAFETRLGLTIEALESADIPGLGADARRRIRLTTLIRTGLLHALLSDEFRFVAVDRDALVAFSRAAFGKDGQVSPPLAAVVARISAEGADVALTDLIERAIVELVEALGPVAERDLDLRYAGELFIVAP